MSSTTVAANTSRPALDLLVAGHSVRLTFGPGLEAVQEEIAALWEHARVPGAVGTARIQLDFVLAEDDAVKAAGPAEGPGAEGVPNGAASALRPPGDAVPLAAGVTASYTVSGHLTRELIEHLIGTRLLVHAAAVAHPKLGTVMLVGASGAGKSTAAVRLGRAGRYLTDELTILDPDDLAITPYPKPVSRRDPPLGAKRDLALPSLGLFPPPIGRSSAARAAEVPTSVVTVPADDRTREHTVPAPMLVVLLERITDEHGVVGSSVARVPPAEALTRIVPQTSSLWAVPGGLAALAALLESTGGALAVRYRDATELEGLLSDIPPPESHGVIEIEGGGDEEPMEDGKFAVTPFQQALAIETGAFVLGRSEAVQLSGLAALVWDLLRVSGPLSEPELEAQVVREIGEHPDSAALVSSTLEELTGRGWVRQG